MGGELGSSTSDVGGEEEEGAGFSLVDLQTKSLQCKEYGLQASPPYLRRNIYLMERLPAWSKA